jgi:hypothetical protein
MQLIESYKNQANSFALSIQTNSEDGRTPSNLLNLAFFTRSFWVKLPPLLKPKEKWVNLSFADWATTNSNGKKGYMEKIKRQYGFSIDKTALHIYYGIQPGSWSSRDPENSDHSKCFFLPWNEQERIRYDFLDLSGEFFADAKDYPNGRIDFDRIRVCEELVPKMKIKFKDYDGEENVATVHIQETEYAQGVGFFKFIRLFIPTKVYRRLEIKYDKETGSRKGSWKGGTVGESCRILEGEDPLVAFRVHGYGKKFSDIWEVR